MTAHDDLVAGLAEHLERSDAAGTAVVVVGAAGSGRTSVLDATADRWRGPVWTTRGGSPLGEPALASSLRRLVPDAETLPVPQREALHRARTMERDEVVDGTSPLVAAIAALASRAAVAHPVLWCVDDLDLADASTRSAVEQVGRLAPQVRLLATAEEAQAGWLDRAIPPMDEDDLAQMLSEQHGLAPPVARTCARLAAGSPGDAHGLAAGLTRRQRDGTDDLPDPWPVGDAMQQRARALVGGLVADQIAAIAMIVASARTHHRTGTTAGDTPSARPEADTLRVARSSGLLDHDDLLAPPWLVDALAVTLPRPVVLTAHRRAAERAGGDDALRHRALASEGVDPALADDLESAARRRTASAQLTEASTLLEHAHSVASTSRRPAVAREVASIALLRGRPGTAQRWSAVAAHDDHRPEALDHTAIYAASSVEPDPQARRQQLREVVAAAATAPAERRAPLAVQLVVWGQTFALPGTLDDAELAESLLPDLGPRDAAVITMTVAIARRLVSVDPAARDLLVPLTPRVHQLLTAAPSTLDVSDASAAPSVAAQWLGVVAMSDERWDDAESLLVAAERLENARGWTVMRASTVAWLAELRWRQGRWDEARELAWDADVDHAGTAAASAVRDAVLARDAALRSTEAVPNADQVGGRGGIGDLLHHHGLALGALGAGRPDVAVEHLRRAERLGDGALDHGGLVWWRADLVEALAGAGDLDAADRVLHGLERVSVDAPLGRAQVLRARATRQQGRSAIRLLAAATDALLGCPVPFEVARTRLALAAALQRELDPGFEAAATAARDTFDSLGAAGWARRAEAMLGDAPATLSWSALTDRGREITREVARGRTNRQIASALGLSEKTVEFHLGRVYRSVGVSGRAELAARFAAAADEVRDDD